MKRIGITAVVLFSVLIISAKEYHVSKSGSDSNDGTRESPLLTIQAAAEIALPGDVITVHKEWPCAWS